MRCLALAALVLVTSSPLRAQDVTSSGQLSLAPHGVASPVLTAEEQEQFLLTARVGRVSNVKAGITGTRRATLTDGAWTHDASIQSIDESKSRFESARRIEFNFRDYWGYNIAAYRLGRMLGLDMVPPSVQRAHRGANAAFTWWVDDVMMDERERAKTRALPPNPTYWNDQIHVLRVFDELIANTDRNQGNMLIDRQWKLWLIDHTRGFRVNSALRTPQTIRRCERTLLERMRSLTRDRLKEELGRYLSAGEIKALLERRDRLVEHVDALGPSALYDLRRPE